MDTGWMTPDFWEKPDLEAEMQLLVGIFSKSAEKRYFVLKGSHFFIFEDETKNEVEGHIDLSKEMKLFVSEAFVLKHGLGCFCIYSSKNAKRYFVMVKDEWVDAITAASLLRDGEGGGGQNRKKRRGSNRSRKNTTDPVKTLFVTGLPHDLKEREIHNMFRMQVGYEGCRLNPGDPPVAFASFDTRPNALAARRAFQGIRFDPSVNKPMRISFAKANSKAPPLPKEFFVNYDSALAPIPQGQFLDPTDSSPVSRRSSAARNRTRNVSRGTSTGTGPMSRLRKNSSAEWADPSFRGVDPELLNKLKSIDFSTSPPADGPHPIFGLLSPKSSPRTQSPTPPPSSHPCSTLFIANIHPSTTETDLTELFGFSPGFEFLKLHYGKREASPVCFVDYDSELHATQAKKWLNGVPFGPTILRIEYARSKMGSSRRGSSVSLLSDASVSTVHTTFTSLYGTVSDSTSPESSFSEDPSISVTNSETG